MDIKEKLNRLAELQSHADIIRMKFDELRAQAMPPEVKQALDDIAAEEKTALEALQDGIDGLTAEIKAEVIQAGETVKGDYMMAVYNKPRVTWDNKGLDGYAVAHPEITAFRKAGEPSVSLRKV